MQGHVDRDRRSPRLARRPSPDGRRAVRGFREGLREIARARELLCDAATGGGSTGRRWRTWTATSWPSRWRRGPGAARGDSAADERMDDLPEVVPRHGVALDPVARRP